MCAFHLSVEECLSSNINHNQLCVLLPTPFDQHTGKSSLLSSPCDLVDSEVYHLAKFPRSTPTHARDIRYQNFLRTKIQTDSKRYISNMPISMWG